VDAFGAATALGAFWLLLALFCAALGLVLARRPQGGSGRLAG
jgi:hypothetical protein